MNSFLPHGHLIDTKRGQGGHFPLWQRSLQTCPQRNVLPQIAPHEWGGSQGSNGGFFSLPQ